MEITKSTLPFSSSDIYIYLYINTSNLKCLCHSKKKYVCEETCMNIMKVKYRRIGIA